MSRPLRIEYPGALYHVVSHGNGRLWLFKHDDAYSTFLDVLDEYIKKYYVVIHNFVIMRNHFHLVVETKLVSYLKWRSLLLPSAYAGLNKVK